MTMEEAIMHLTPAFLRIFILVLLFFVTAAPSVVDSTRAVNVITTPEAADGVAPKAHRMNQVNKNAADGITSGANQVNAERDTNHDGIARTSKGLRQAHRNTNDGVVPINKELGYVSRNSSDADTHVVEELFTTPHLLKSKGEQVSESDPFAITDQVDEHVNANHAYDHHDQGLISPADGHDPGTKTPTFQSK
jgi:hypothetical protein